jgi:Zn-dependent protease
MTIFSLIAILLAVSVHEAAHAWMANRLGDPTARLSGRLTLNPFAHLDILGTISLIFFGFGWGKPVPVDAYNLRYPRRDSAIISLAGPLSNIIFTIVAAFSFRLFPIPYSLIPLIYSLITINLSLALFNLLPLGPLDGAKIILGVLSFDKAEAFEDFMERYGLITLIFLLLPLFFGRSLIDLFLSPTLDLILKILIGGAKV